MRTKYLFDTVFSLAVRVQSHAQNMYDCKDRVPDCHNHMVVELTSTYSVNISDYYL